MALPILPVVVRAPGSQRCVHTYALLDSGSTNTFCSEDLVREFQLKGEKTILSLTTLDKTNSQTHAMVVSLEVSDMANKNVTELPVVYVRPTLPVHMRNMGRLEDTSRWTHLKDVDIPQVDTQKVTLLIGQDNPDVLIPVAIKKGKPGDPYATKTLLGWSLNGPLGGTRQHAATTNFVQADQDLSAQLEKFWKIEGCESLAEDRKGLSYEDKQAVAIWEETIRHHVDKHYEVAIPFRSCPPSLPHNQVMAEQRLESLRRRLIRDTNLHMSYTGFMEELIDKGYAEKVVEDEIDKAGAAVWYLPHHSVVQPKKPDKVRIVFDCKAKYHGTSLNDQVLRGPDLANTLLGVLLRFRQERVALMADVEAMFHQVRVSPDDRDVLRFLWWPGGDLQQDPQTFRMAVHLFGGTWSPSCCNFILQRTAQDNQRVYDDETVETVLKDFYVDDCLKSVANEDQAIRLVRQLCDLLSEGGFRLTKWVSNSRPVLSTIEEKDRAKQVKEIDLNYEALPTERALGVYWDVESDCFSYKITIREKPLTKRGLLSIVSSVYDPLGFACPYSITAKKILQDLTRMKKAWDDPLPDAELERWLCWRGGLESMEQVKISRCIQPPDFGQIMHIQLHHFSDASETAYGVASYVRLVDTAGHVHCVLMMAKSRLAPLKQMTIPRLELTAATMSVRLDMTIRRELSMHIHESIFWTDSMLVLRYISNENRRFQTFVANRVATIRDGSSASQWRYVDSKSNPADDASRGLSADEMVNKRRWLQGPSFLRQEESAWPKTPNPKAQIPDDDPEVKRAQVCLVEETHLGTVIDQLLERRSSWYMLKKDLAWILRFKLWLRNKARGYPMQLNKGPLTVKETKTAEIEIVKYVQRQNFVNEVKTLEYSDKQGSGKKTESRQIKRSSTIYRLVPVMTPMGVLVVGGRLKNAPIPDETKHQMILPRRHHVVDLIVRHFHECSGHLGREYVLSQIRQQFWIIHARSAVRRVLGNCFGCRRRNALPCEQKMADLPRNRVTPDEPPFTYVGIDYFGTFYVKRGRSQVKRYGCIFTCFAIRAIHIEVAHSLDTSSFINALQRFISRRGQPKEITSDNGSNFVGGMRELREAIEGWNQTKIQQFLHQRGIQWKFNPPAASHMGGVWERQIRTVRKVLRALMKEQVVDDEGLSTLMCLVEAIVNGRPLTTNSDDPRDLEALSRHVVAGQRGLQLRG